VNKTVQICPAGTFNTIDGSSVATDCVNCPPGYFCPNVAGQGKINACPAGSYCLEGASQGITCPIGYYCPSGTNMPIPCPPGKYCSTIGLFDLLTLPECKEGYFCTFESYSVAAGSTSGFVCNSDSTSKARTCIRGATVSNQNLCPKGFFCPTGSETPTACPIGTFSNTLGNTD
jgi:hypothetical protein